MALNNTEQNNIKKDHILNLKNEILEMLNEDFEINKVSEKKTINDHNKDHSIPEDEKEVVVIQRFKGKVCSDDKKNKAENNKKIDIYFSN